jgi:hypothetical protein
LAGVVEKWNRIDTGVATKLGKKRKLLILNPRSPEYQVLGINIQRWIE